MATLHYGLNAQVKVLSQASKPAPAKRKTIFDDDSDAEDKASTAQAGEQQEVNIFGQDATTSGQKSKTKAPSAQPPKPKSTTYQHADLSTLRDQSKQIAEAQSLDPSIYDYDAAYDALHATSLAKKALARADAEQRNPKYIESLLAAAEVRKRDQLRAKDKLLQKEREAEGEDFADKEKFVTGAYKEQQEAVRRAEEAETRRQEEEEKRRKGKGMQGFYKGVLEEEEMRHAESIKAAREVKAGGMQAVEEDMKEKSAAELAREMNERGANIMINEDGQVIDKRQLLSAGLNVATKHKIDTGIAANRGGAQRPGVQQGYQGRTDAQKAQRDRQTRLVEVQLEKAAKRAAEEEVETRQKLERAAKSQKTESEISGARERYLRRKMEAAAAALAGHD